MDKDLLDKYICDYSIEELKMEVSRLLNEMKMARQNEYSWVIDPSAFVKAECPPTGQQRLFLLGFLFVGTYKVTWLCDRVRASQIECLQRFTALHQEVETKLDSLLKGNRTEVRDVLDFAAQIICFHRTREDPWGLNARQLQSDPQPYRPYPQFEQPKRKLDLDDL